MTRVFLIAYATIVRKETFRIFRIWKQTLLPPVITATLYYVIFGAFLGSRIGLVEGVPYIAFIVPGLVMMAVIVNSYSNTASSFFGEKFQHSIEELMVAPVPPYIIIAGYATGGVLRGSIVGVLSLIVALFFTHLPIVHLGVILLFFILTSVLFSLAGLLNGVFAKNFDSVQIFPTFVLTPLIYLGGVFYPISVLPTLWQHVSLANPILYVVNGFRYGFLGHADVSLSVSFSVIITFIVILIAILHILFQRGYGMRT